MVFVQPREEGSDLHGYGLHLRFQGIEHFLGPEEIGRIAPNLSIPFTVMGGIKESNIGQVLAAGATKVAVVTAITQAPDIAEAVRSFRNRIASRGSKNC